MDVDKLRPDFKAGLKVPVALLYSNGREVATQAAAASHSVIRIAQRGGFNALGNELETSAAPAAPANPLFSASSLPFQSPPFDRIRNEHYRPAFEEGMKPAQVAERSQECSDILL